MRIGRICLAILLSLWLSGTAFSQRVKADLKIGTVVPLTGSLAAYGKELLHGMEMALEDIAKQDSSLAERMKIVTRDDRSLASEAGDIAKELLESRQADVLFGSVTSTATLAMIEAVKGTDKPIITPTATNELITKLDDNVYRTCFQDRLQGFALAEFVARTLKKTKVALLIEDTSSYSDRITNAFVVHFKKLGGQIVAKETYTTGDTNFEPQLGRLSRKRPQIILSPGYYQEIGLIIRQARKLNMTAPFVGSDAWDSDQFYDIAGSTAARGNYFTTHFSASDPDPKVQTFVRKYESRFNRNPSLLAAMGYDGMMVLAAAFERANSNLAGSLNRALAGTNNIAGLVGPVSFTRGRDALKPVSIISTTASGSEFRTKISMTTSGQDE